MTASTLPDLAVETLGGAVIAANDEFFAPKENLVRADAPVWDAHRYTDRGKWMDGWETRRRREPGHDWCIVRLGVPGVLHEAVVDTTHFRGNHPEAAGLEGTHAPSGATAAALARAEWVELLPATPLAADRRNVVTPTAEAVVTHVRLAIHPDGGVARLRLHGEPVPDWAAIAGGGRRLDLATVAHGGRVLDASDWTFSDPGHLLLPSPPRGMFDGWETRRRRGEGHDWVRVALGAPAVVTRLGVDTTYFRGNAPAACEVVGRRGGGPWRPLLPRTPLRADTPHRFRSEVVATDAVDEVRLDIHPDGGVARLHVIGTVARDDVADLAVSRLDRLPPAAAVTALLACCGSGAWARGVAARRPLRDARALHAAADEVWAGLGGDDWLEAFAAHPRIGERTAAHDTGARSRGWSGREQAGVRDTDRDALAEVNRAYEQRFGWILLVCATGLDSTTILARARERLGNDPDTELRVAAEEQRRITHLRLDKLLGKE
jgi:allantoicase